MNGFHDCNLHVGFSGGFVVQISTTSNKDQRVHLSFVSKTRGRLVNLAKNWPFYKLLSEDDWRYIFAWFSDISTILYMPRHTWANKN